MTTLTIKYAKGISQELRRALKPIGLRMIKKENIYWTYKFIGVLDNYVEILESFINKYKNAIPLIRVN